MRFVRFVCCALLVAAQAQAGMIAVGIRGGAGAATITWQAPTTKGDQTALSDIASYNVKYSTATGVHNITVNVTAPASSKVLTGLVVGVPIYVVITAVRTSGEESPETPEITVTPA